MGVDGSALALGAFWIIGALALAFSRTASVRAKGLVTVADGNGAAEDADATEELYGQLGAAQDAAQDAAQRHDSLQPQSHAGSAAAFDPSADVIARKPPQGVVAWASAAWGRLTGGGGVQKRVRARRGNNPKLSIPVNDPDEPIDGELD
jgi:hypothetical protein